MEDTKKLIITVPTELYTDLVEGSGIGYILNTYRQEIETALNNHVLVKEEKWTPVNDIEDIPKRGTYWVSKNYGFGIIVEKIRWSDVWQCWEDNDSDEALTKESASLITAYMPYAIPRAYEKGGEEG